MCNLSALRYPIILMAMLCASCGTALPSIKPYKLDVQQGNVVTSKMLLQLRPGMTQSQVRFIMGTPLIQDSFHGKRWDYVYQMRENGKITEQRRVILDFENDLLKTVRGDVIAAAGDASKAGEVADNTGARVINPSAKADDKSLLGKLKFWEKDPAASPAGDAKTKVDEPAKEAVAPVAATQPKPADMPPAEQAKLVTDAPAAEQPSVLAVPVLPVEPSAPAAVAAPATIAAEPPAPVTVAPSVDATPTVAEPVSAAEPTAPTNAAPAVESAPAVETTPAVESAAVQSAPVEPAVAAPVQIYESPSGMQFERNLSRVPEDIAPLPAPKVVTPAAAGADLPKAKELPATPKPSFFDRMLEKIGF